MKKKFNFWLNIVTICFCVCAVAVGVYSATTASITASGKIGFTAHGCKVEVGGSIYGHGVKDGADHQDGLPVPSNTPVPFATATLDGTVANGVTGDFNIGNRYFSDMESTTGAPAPIVITITVTNRSNYDIEVSTNLNPPDLILPDAQVSIELTNGEATQTIAKDKVATFVYTLTLNPDQNTTSTYTGFPLANLVIPMAAVKYVAPEGNKVMLNVTNRMPGGMEIYCLIDGSETRTILTTGQITGETCVIYVNEKLEIGFEYDSRYVEPGYTFAFNITPEGVCDPHSHMIMDNAFLSDEISIEQDVSITVSIS